MALRHGTWMDEESFKQNCIKEKGKGGGTHKPFHGTWVAHFMLRHDAGPVESLCWGGISATKIFRFVFDSRNADFKPEHVFNLFNHVANLSFR